MPAPTATTPMMARTTIRGTMLTPNLRRRVANLIVTHCNMIYVPAAQGLKAGRGQTIGGP